ncbi:methyltransferase domain-containing protein [uncultured Paraglaciecola sp.]|uniref:methyltransferase domain-containing protein n=1 Tax=uncultured Paraglaciecola sp. TaxID=1765024 RepID=UPI0030DD3375|tara:strand:- start:942 stop:1766 length:825 start_codon:yes stop_codon:yes gene_type:complete
MTNTSIASRNKIRIAQQFSRAANTYNSAADVQLDIAFDALAYLPSHYQNGLDIGCGTGRISQQLSTRCDRLIAMDLAFGMLAYAQKNNVVADPSICWLQGDADCLPLADDSVDMLFSSMALQWADNQQKVMAEITRVLAAGSNAILAIMCDGSFKQLNDTWLNIDNHRHVNNFATAQSWCDAARSQGLQVNMQEKRYVTWHQDIRKLLSSIKSIGANVVLKSQNLEPTDARLHQGKNLLNRETLQHLETYYQQKYAENRQLPLTYQVCFLHCSK